MDGWETKVVIEREGLVARAVRINGTRFEVRKAAVIYGSDFGYLPVVRIDLLAEPSFEEYVPEPRYVPDPFPTSVEE